MKDMMFIFMSVRTSAANSCAVMLASDWAAAWPFDGMLKIIFASTCTLAGSTLSAILTALYFFFSRAKKAS